MKKEILIFDTSIFVNPASAHAFGKNPTEALTVFLEQAAGASIDVLMPPSIYSELMFFADEKKIPRKLLAKIRKHPPRKHELKIPGIFIYELVENMRDRIDRGLRLSERHVREALKLPPVEPGPPEKGKVRPDAEIVGRLRESYRRIMREGMLDSRADVDLLLLTYQLEGTLVSADQGVLDWADNLGIKILPHDHLPEYLKERKK